VRRGPSWVKNLAAIRARARPVLSGMGGREMLSPIEIDPGLANSGYERIKYSRGGRGNTRLIVDFRIHETDPP